MKTRYTRTNWNSVILVLSTYFCFIVTPLISSVPNNSGSQFVNSSGTVFHYSGTDNTIDFIRVAPSEKISELEHLKWLVNDILRLPKTQSLSLIKTSQDQLGYTHYRYLQTNFGIPVEGAMYLVHCKEGKVVSANGKVKKIETNPPAPYLSAKKAYNVACNSVPTIESVSIVKSANVQDKLVWIEDTNNNFKLAYQFEIKTTDILNHSMVFVDAGNGEVLNKLDLIQYSNKPTVAKSAYYGNVTINVDSISPNNYRLLSDKQSCLLETKTYENRYYLPLREIQDSDNSWDSTTIHQYEIDAHYSLEAVYDYFYTTFGRNSIDNAGSPVTVGVHYGNWTNTATYSTDAIMCGDGDRVLYRPFTSIEMIGHEFAHGIISNELSNVYVNTPETRSLIEGISDCFAVAVDVFKYPNGANFLIGDKESISHRPIRSISNPESLSLPETYRGENWDDYDYTSNGTVVGYWFFMLSRGGSGINSFQEAYVVDSIGMGKAANILYRTVVNYFTSTSLYSEFSYATIQSAVDLYGVCSPEVKSVIDAWKAVGVKNDFILNRKASFITDKNYSCNGPTTLSFTNTSINATNYLWYFGDGDTSTVVNPTHTYSATGNYDVTLIAYNQIDCSVNDTIIKENCISISNSSPVIAASCNGTTPNVLNIGIKNVQLNTINHSSDYAYNEGNLDLTCTERTEIVSGSTPLLTVTTFNTNEIIKAWIDYNNDGIFNTTTEEVFYKTSGSNVNSDYILNTSNAVLNVPLRMRIAGGTSNIPTPCNFYHDQAEDYSIVFIDDSLPPSVDFVANNRKVSTNSSIKFQGVSKQKISSWQWSFPGGNPSSSTIANPVVSYSSPGVYSVTLIVTNSWGTDSITKTNYVYVAEKYNLCATTTQSTLPFGELYDNGGPNSNYSMDSHCGFVIDAGCNKRLKLHLEYLTIAPTTTRLKIYEGTDSTGKQVCSYDRNQKNIDFVINSGSVCIRFNSYYGGVSSGFKLVWEAEDILKLKPTASFSLSTINPALYSDVQFTDLSTDLPTSWLWDFGDGSSSTKHNPSHKYTTPGTFQIKLIARNCVGVDSSFQTIVVQGPPIFNYSPQYYEDTLSCNDSLTFPITIKNTGSGNLIFESYRIEADSMRLLIFAPGNNIENISDLFPQFKNLNLYYPNYKTSVLDIGDPDLLDSAMKNNDILVFSGYILHDFNFSAFKDVVNGILAEGKTIIFSQDFDQSGNLLRELGLLKGSLDNVSGNLSITNLSDELAANMPAPTTGNGFAYNTSDNDIVPILICSGKPIAFYKNIGGGRIVYSGIYSYPIPAVTSRFLANVLKTSKGALPSMIDLNWPFSDTIAPNDSVTIDVKLKSDRLSNGVYNKVISFKINDNSNPIIDFPIFLTVTGEPQIGLNKSCINFTSKSPYDLIQDSILISNLGCDTLRIDSITFSSNVFSTNNTSFKIKPHSAFNLIVNNVQAQVGALNATMNIYSNDIDTSICLNSNVLAGPHITAIQPSQIADTTGLCVDTMYVNIVVANTGYSNLQVQTSATSTKIKRVLIYYDVSDFPWSTLYSSAKAAMLNNNPNILIDSTNTSDSIALRNMLLNTDILAITRNAFNIDWNFTANIYPIMNEFILNGGTIIDLANPLYEMNWFTPCPFISYYNLNNGTNGNVITGINSDSCLNGLPLQFSSAYYSVEMNSMIDFTPLIMESNTSNVTVFKEKFGLGEIYYLGFSGYAPNSSEALLLSNLIKFNHVDNPVVPIYSSTTYIIAPGDTQNISIPISVDSLSDGINYLDFTLVSNDPIDSIIHVTSEVFVKHSSCAEISFVEDSLCGGTVYFTGSSNQYTTSKYWDFGDGSTGSGNIINHTYAAPGTYFVQYTTCVGNLCDSITYPIVIDSVNGPRKACIPPNLPTCCNVGIMNVSIADINNSTQNATEGYKDFACSIGTNLLLGEYYPIVITTGSTGKENVGVWIDYNNDAVFQTSEKVLNSTNTIINHTGSFIVPMNAVTNKQLRMRVVDQGSTYPSTYPCTGTGNGQSEDYYVYISPSTQAPQAAIIFGSYDSCNMTVSFIDSSRNVPDTWYWDFGDGDTSSLRNPIHTFANAGSHTVTLIASNAFGSDTTFITFNLFKFVTNLNISGVFTQLQPIVFTATSNPTAISCLWDFADGTTSTLNPVTHTFIGGGVYQIVNTTSDGTCTNIIHQTIYIGGVGLEENNGLNNFDISPNPFIDQLNVEYNLNSQRKVSLKLLDIAGREVNCIVLDQLQSAGQYHYSFADVKAGVYMIELTVDNRKETRKAVKIK
jgi:PKD repeat protein